MANKDYSFRQILEIEACTNCRICADVCPAVTAAGDGELSAVYRIDGIRKILKSRSSLLSRLFRANELSEDQWNNYSNTVFRCTLCGNCQEVCPVGINLKDLWLALRQDLVHTNVYPKKLKRVRENLDNEHNVFGEDNEERIEWVEDMRDPPDDEFLKDKAEVVYFTGCVASYFPVAQKIPIALAEIMTSCRVDFTLLGEEEWCCGFPLLGAGMPEELKGYIDHNIEAIRKKGAKEVVFACPSCYQMWLEYYPKAFKISHATQYLCRLIEQNKVPFKELPMTVTYHDPCDLGRGARIFDEPREVIQSIPGITFVELPHNRENCQCCGGGGNLEMVDAQLAAEIAKRKVEEALATGAQAIVTSCQQCVRTMLTYVRRNKIHLEVMDIIQLVRRALKQG